MILFCVVCYRLLKKKQCLFIQKKYHQISFPGRGAGNISRVLRKKIGIFQLFRPNFVIFEFVDQILACFDFLESTKNYSTLFDPVQKCFDVLDRNWVSFDFVLDIGFDRDRPIFRLCSTHISVFSTEIWYVSTVSTFVSTFSTEIGYVSTLISTYVSAFSIEVGYVSAFSIEVGYVLTFSSKIGRASTLCST